MQVSMRANFWLMMFFRTLTEKFAKKPFVSCFSSDESKRQTFERKFIVWIELND